MALPETTALALDRQDGVLHATLDRPDAGNALDAGLIDDLVNTFNAVRDDRSVRVVVLRGAGDHFCVGADLNAREFRVDRLIRGRAERNNCDSQSYCKDPNRYQRRSCTFFRKSTRNNC